MGEAIIIFFTIMYYLMIIFIGCLFLLLLLGLFLTKKIKKEQNKILNKNQETEFLHERSLSEFQELNEILNDNDIKIII